MWCTPSAGAAVTVVAGEGLSGIDFTVARGGTISGIVRNTLSGTGIPNANVYFLDASGAQFGGVTTDGSGRYSSGVGLPGGQYHVRTTNNAGLLDQYYDHKCTGSSCLPTSTDSVTVTAGADTPGIDFDLGYSASITGVVTDATTALPIAGVRVQLWTVEGETASAQASAPTTSDGRYTFSNLVPGVRYARTTNTIGYIDEVYDGIVCPQCSGAVGSPITLIPGNSVTVNFALEPGNRISGTVRTVGSNEPIGGVQIVAYDSNGGPVNAVMFFPVATSAPDGTYQIRGLPAGTYFLKALGGNGYQSGLYGGLACFPSCDPLDATPVTVDGTVDLTGVDFALESGGRIAGTVLDAVTGASIPASVVVYSAGGTYLWTVYTDQNGTYQTNVGLPAGEYFLAAQAAGKVMQLYSGRECATCRYAPSSSNTPEARRLWCTGTPVPVVAVAVATGS